MNSAKIMKVVCVAGLSAACAWSLAGCANGDASGSSGGTAATVNGVDIPESTITEYIESYRTSASLTDEDSWGQWMADNDMTPETVREEIIDSFVTRELVNQGADEKGITVDSSEIDSYVEKTKENYDSDEKWQAALEQVGLTEQDYRDELELQLKSKSLQESFASDEEPSQEDLLSYAQMYASAYDGAKKSSHILFASDDQETAQKVLDQINSGELDFVTAVKEYSKDTTSAEDDGNVGWDKTSNLVTEYTDALSGLSKGQVSGLVTSEYGIHIIKCTDVFNAPKTTGDDGTETVEVTSLDQIPSEWLDSIKSSLKSQQESEAYNSWLEDYKSSADIEINDMPEGLSYDLDMSNYTSSDDSSDDTADSTSTDDSTASTSDGTSTDDSTASSSDGTDASTSSSTEDTASSDAATESSTEQSTVSN